MHRRVYLLKWLTLVYRQSKQISQELYEFFRFSTKFADYLLCTELRREPAEVYEWWRMLDAGHPAAFEAGKCLLQVRSTRKQERY